MEFLRDFLAMTRQRVSNPFFMAFLFSWFALNHDYLFIMFSGDSLAEKFAQLDQQLYPSNLFGLGLDGAIIFWIRSLVAPAFMAVTYILLMPPFQGLMINVWDKKQNKLLEAQKKVQGQVLISEADRNKLYAELEDERNKWRILDKDKDDVIARLETKMDLERKRHQSQQAQDGQTIEQKQNIIIQLQEERDSFNNELGKIENIKNDLDSLIEHGESLVTSFKNYFPYLEKVGVNDELIKERMVVSSKSSNFLYALRDVKRNKAARNATK